MEYYTAVKINIVELHAIMRVNLNIILSTHKKSKTQKNTSNVSPLI